MRTYSLSALIIWGAVLIAGSLQPWRAPSLSYGHGLHSALHMLAFGGLAVLAILTSSRWRGIPAIVCCWSLGLALELAQHRLYGHLVEWRDVRDNSIGIALFWALALAGLAASRRRAEITP